MLNYLPCINCGANLSIVEGSLVQCFHCGTKSTYSDSIKLLNDYLMEILNMSTKTKVEETIDPQEIVRRKSAISSFFHEISEAYYDYKYLILTKIDDIELDSKKLLELIRKIGTFKIIINSFLMPLVKEGLSKNELKDIRDSAHIFHKSLLGLYFSSLAKEKFKIEDCSEFYQFAERNYKNNVEYCDILKIENPNFNITKTKTLYSTLEEFAKLLRNILNENPTYSTEIFESLLADLDSIPDKGLKIHNLRTQIESIYSLGRDTSLILEEIRVADVFKIIDPLQENLLYNTEEVSEKFDKIKNWIEESTEKYNQYQKNLLKLHSGKFISYLESYRKEFTHRKKTNLQKFDELLDRVISKAMGDYNLETIESLDILSDFVKKLDLTTETIIQRFQEEHDVLLKMDETLKNFVLGLFKKTFLKDLESLYSAELISLISGKHSEFDTYLLKFIYQILRDFEDYRNEKVLSIEEQKNFFILELKPNIKRLIDASFTIHEDLIPYPLFIEVIMLSKMLTVNQEEKISVLIENPGKKDVKNINISFFVFNSFKSQLRYAQLRKIKSQERIQVDTEIIPTEKGIYHFMVMVEYKNVGETFWMPSIKFELEVNEEI